MSASTPGDAAFLCSDPLRPTETPLRPLCPGCGAESVRVHTSACVSLEVASPARLGELQVLALRLGEAAWDEGDVAACGSCDWRGTVADIRSQPSGPEPRA